MHSCWANMVEHLNISTTNIIKVMTNLKLMKHFTQVLDRKKWCADSFHLIMLCYSYDQGSFKEKWHKIHLVLADNGLMPSMDVNSHAVGNWTCFLGLQSPVFFKAISISGRQLQWVSHTVSTNSWEMKAASALEKLSISNACVVVPLEKVM